MLVRLLLTVFLATLDTTEVAAYKTPSSTYLRLFDISNKAPSQANEFRSERSQVLLAANGVTSDIGSVLSKSKDREVSSGLFRKISFTNKDFDYDEILSTEDAEEYRGRFRSLMALFPEISESDLRALVFTSPLLLALETESLQAAVSRLTHELPYINPNYVIAQRSCGIDLLLSCMSPMFDLETRRNDVIAVIGKERNVTEFLRRVPHCLTPRYLLALKDHCYILKEMLQIDTRTSIDIVERWPGILGIDLAQSVIRFNTSLHKLDLIHPDEPATILISKLLRAVPRCLLQDMPRRSALLKRNFPHWDLQTIILKYPRVLTQKMQGLTWHHQTLSELLAPLNVSADNFVNAFPRSLGHNPHQLVAAAHGVSCALPGLSVHDIYSRAPRILSVRTKEVLMPQIERLKKAFYKHEHCSSKEHSGHVSNNAKKNSHSESSIRTSVVEGDMKELSMKELPVYLYDDNEDDFTADIDASIAVGTDAVSHETAQLLAIIGIEAATQFAAPAMEKLREGRRERETAVKVLKEGNRAVVDSTVNNNHIMTASIGAESHIPHIAVASSHESINNQHHHIKSPISLIKEQVGGIEEEMSVTRIIIGNLDIFIDRHPYFMDKIGGWIKDFGPRLAHSVLSAVPAALTKKTTTLRPVLKRLHSLISEADSDVGSAVGVESKENKVDSVTPQQQSISLYDKLNILLLEAPSLLKKKPADIDFRLQQLMLILDKCISSDKDKELPPVIVTDSDRGSSSSSGTHSQSGCVSLGMKAQQLAVGAPRLLVESKIERLIFRTRLLLHFHRKTSAARHTKSISTTDSTKEVKKSKRNPSQASINKKILQENLIELKTTAWMEDLLLSRPQVLAGPSSTLARLFFANALLLSSESDTAGLTHTSDDHSPASNSKHSPIPKQHDPLTIPRIESLLDCNTKTFLLRLSDLNKNIDCHVLDSTYGFYLQSVIRKMRGHPPFKFTCIESQSSETISDSISESVPVPGSTSVELECSAEDESDVIIDSNHVSGSHRELTSIAAVVLATSTSDSSSELERLLCGLFNDLCSIESSPASPVLTTTTTTTTATTSPPKSSIRSDSGPGPGPGSGSGSQGQEGTHEGTTHNSAPHSVTDLKISTNGQKNSICIETEINRIDQLCKTVGSILLSASTNLNAV